MKKMKRFSAALMAVVMAISMLSCMVIGASAEVASAGSGADVMAGLDVPVTNPLPGNLVVVDDDWSAPEDWDQTPFKVNVNYKGTVYSASFGTNAFNNMKDAMAAAKAGDTVYLAPGYYEDTAEVRVSNLTIEGAYAGVTPNDPAATTVEGLSNINPARINADASPDAAVDESVFGGRLSLYGGSSGLKIDGVYLSGGASGVGTTSILYLAEGGKWKVGPHVTNCVISTGAGYLVDSLRGRNPDIIIEKSRVQRAKSLVGAGGMMGITIRDNYINCSAVAAYFDSIEYGSGGQACLVENNYFATCGGLVNTDRGSTGYGTASYSVQVKDNYIAEMSNTYLVQMGFYARHTMPDTNLIFTGNTVMGIKASSPMFKFNYYELSGYQLIMSRYRININENYFDMPAGTPFIASGMNGIMNCAYNYYNGSISTDQVTKYQDAELILYPYYSDAEMTTLVGDVKISNVVLPEAKSIEIDHKKQLIEIDLGDWDPASIDLANELSPAIVVSEGCKWELYEDKMLNEKVKDRVLYFDGVDTHRFIKVTNPDGASAVYALYVKRAVCSDAELLDIVLSNSSMVSGPVVEEGNISIAATYTYELAPNLAFMDYDLKVSSGAKVELYDNAFFSGNQLKDMGGYIPYIGYKEAGEPFAVYAKVISEDGQNERNYKIVFKRERSETYDPAIVGASAKEQGNFMLRQSYKWIGFYPETLLKEVTIDLQATPGAFYEIYADKKLTKKLSPNAALEPVALPLTSGNNTFYVKVYEPNGTNVYELVVFNETLSDNANITGLSGISVPVMDGEITVNTGSSNLIATFTTANPYATVKVFADAAKKYPISYTSNKTVEASGRVIDERTFNLPAEGRVCYYYVVSTAEDGKTKAEYKMIVNQTGVSDVTYKDIKKSAWYYEYVYEATKLGCVNGSQDKKGNWYFNPSEDTTREQMAVIVTRIAGLAGANFESVKLPYADRAKISSWALPYMKATYAAGLMSGSKSGNKIYGKPAAKVTRGEVMVMIAALIDCKAKANLNQFKDGSKVPDWGKAAAQEVVGAGLVTGDNKGKLNFDSPITRAEIATIAAATVHYLNK